MSEACLRPFVLLSAGGLWLLAAQASATGSVETGLVPETGLRFWEWRGDGLSLRYVQRLPDQTRGFFEARGFSTEAQNRIAYGCVFQTIFKNERDSQGMVQYDLSAWRVHSGGRSQGLKLKDAWDREWQALGLPEATRIAFRWSLIPDQQQFQPGDYNWGMTSFDLPPGSRFDLEFNWSRAGVAGSAVIEGIECPLDIHPKPVQEHG